MLGRTWDMQMLPWMRLGIVHATGNSRTWRLPCTLSNMNKSAAICSLLCLLAAPAWASGADLDGLVNNELLGLVDTYKGIHAHPELSHHEERTAAVLAAELRKGGYTVTE